MWVTNERVARTTGYGKLASGNLHASFGFGGSVARSRLQPFDSGSTRKIRSDGVPNLLCTSRTGTIKRPIGGVVWVVVAVVVVVVVGDCVFVVDIDIGRYEPSDNHACREYENTTHEKYYYHSHVDFSMLLRHHHIIITTTSLVINHGLVYNQHSFLFDVVAIRMRGM